MNGQSYRNSAGEQTGRRNSGEIREVYSSLLHKFGDAYGERTPEATRAHWSVENQLHWRLDMGMREDECQIVRGEAGENLAVCRHIAMNLLTAENSFKAGIKRKQKRAGRKNEYLSLILAGCGPS